jgi:hypothetical protein
MRAGATDRYALCPHTPARSLRRDQTAADGYNLVSSIRSGAKRLFGLLGVGRELPGELPDEPEDRRGRGVLAGIRSPFALVGL